MGNASAPQKWSKSDVESKGERLGQGAFGTVYKVNINGSLYAVKIVNTPSTALAQLALRELQNLGKVQGHKNVIKVFSATDEGSALLIWMEFCNQGNLEDYTRGRSLDIDAILDLMRQLVDAVQFIHGKGVIHRDIKPQNIMLNGGAGKPTLKLVDFGIGNLAASIEYFQTFAGTEGYMAPEVATRRYTFSADVYSVGQVFKSIGQRLAKSPRKDKFLQLANEMSREKPKERLSLQEVKARLQDI